MAGEERLHLARTDLRINYNQKLALNHLYNDITHRRENLSSKAHLRTPLAYTEQM